MFGKARGWSLELEGHNQAQVDHMPQLQYWSAGTKSRAFSGIRSCPIRTVRTAPTPTVHRTTIANVRAKT